jgi:flagellar biosynthesis/type III secretory pathway chaperone
MTTQHLTSLLEQKHDCLTQLRDLGARQLERIDAGDMATLMKVLSAKQRILADLQSVERGLDPFRGELPEERAWRSPAERDHCTQLIRRCQLLFSEIVEQEREAELRLILERDDAEQRLRGMHVAAGAHGAYLQNASTSTSSLDLSTES